MLIESTYILLFVMPAAFFWSLMAFLIGRGIPNRESKVFFLACFSYFMAHIGELARHVVDIAYSPFLATYMVSFFLVLGTCAILHLSALLLAKSLRFKLSYWHYIIYLPILFPVVIGFIPTLRLQETDFYWSGIWLYRQQSWYTIGTYIINLIPSITACIILLIGYVKSTHRYYKKHFLFYLCSGIVITSGIAVLMILFQDYALPPVPTLTISIFTCSIIVISVIRYNISLSVASRYKQLLTLTPSAVVLLDEYLTIVEANRKARQLFANNKAKVFDDMFSVEENRKVGRLFLEKLQKRKVIKGAIYSFWNPLLEEQQYYVFDAEVIKVEGEHYYFILWRDVTKEQQQAQRIQELAFHDQLTGLHNRAYFLLAMEAQLNTNEPALFVLADLNFFKQINDTYGHPVGDEVLQHVATLFCQFQGEDTLIARFGGDEFLLYIPLHGQDVTLFIQKLRDIFVQQPYKDGDLILTISPSFGFAHIPKEGQQFEALYHLADERMYIDKLAIKTQQLKESGHGNYKE